jgi:hypothetical protein
MTSVCALGLESVNFARNEAGGRSISPSILAFTKSIFRTLNVVRGR